ncbi:MAG TPA: glycosyltransferase N-terminal domain-containing protein, partial [Burkholderiaceae bacterium]|nr:glycosyltransferase N-terminal domain-containing protein [Burkholderiaceae bacterium]
MNRFFYNIAIVLLAPILLIWMGLRARRAGGNWAVLSPNRFGYYPSNNAKHHGGSPIWVHAVSLGETRATQPLIKALLDQGDTVLLTHMTATGRAAAAAAFSDAIDRGQLIQEWLPYDFYGSSARFLDYYQPQIGIMIEREIWPNVIAAAYRRRIPMVLASARFSDLSLRQSLRMGSLMRNAYQRLSAVYAQTLADAQRLEQAGANAVRVSGNFKFDVKTPEELIRRGHEFAER